MPSWTGSMFWAYMALEEGVKERERFRPFLNTPDFFKNRMFVGWPKFDFSVFEFYFFKKTDKG